MTPHRRQEDLSPCPFCGCAAERHDIMDEEPANFGGSVIQCTRCLCSTRVIFGEKEGLYDAWNTRAMSALQAENERLRKALREIAALKTAHRLSDLSRLHLALKHADGGLSASYQSSDRRVDRERLDWLERSCVHVYSPRLYPGKGVGCGTCLVSHNPMRSPPTIRDAIDAAMGREGQGNG